MPKPHVQIFAGTSTGLHLNGLSNDSPPSSPTTSQSRPASYANRGATASESLDPDSAGFLRLDNPHSEDEYDSCMPTPRPPDYHKDYDYFETLSLVQAAIKTSTLLPSDLLRPIVISSPNDVACLADHKQGASFVTGVDLFGQRVGEHIVNNLLCLFDALARGHDDIILLAHSRGAVAAILTAHELDAIKNTTDGANLHTLLTKTPCAYTKAALEKLSPEQIRWLQNNSETIINRIRGGDDMQPASFSLFGIDPVPGNGLGFTWYDERYFILPAILEHAEIILAQDERSAGFRAIVPHAADPSKTRLKITPLPGHHGTASGNLDNQNRTRRDIKQTRHVQKLVLSKITQHLKQHNVPLIKQRFSRCFDLGRDAQLALYNKIHANLFAYRALANHAYVALEQIEGQRAICTHHINKPQAAHTVLPVTPGYVNHEHLLLDFESIYKQAAIHPIEVLATLNARLDGDPHSLLETATRTQHLEPGALETKITALINTISIAYLKNNLHPEEKILLTNEIVRFLAQLSSSDHLAVLFRQVTDGITETIQAQLARLEGSHRALEEALQQPTKDNQCLATSLTDVNTGLLHQCQSLKQGLGYFKQRLQDLCITLSLERPIQQVGTIEEAIRNTLRTYPPTCEAGVQTDPIQIVAPPIQQVSMIDDAIRNILRTYPLTCEAGVQTDPIQIVKHPFPDTLVKALAKDPSYCKQALATLKKACLAYLAHVEHQNPLSNPEKHQAVTLIMLAINAGAGNPFNTFVQLRETLQAENNPTLPILAKNCQSCAEVGWKILAVLSVLFGLALAVKRLYDSGGRSINFFKPLSQTMVEEPLRTMMVLRP